MAQAKLGLDRNANKKKKKKKAAVVEEGPSTATKLFCMNKTSCVFSFIPFPSVFYGSLWM